MLERSDHPDETVRLMAAATHKVSHWPPASITGKEPEDCMLQCKVGAAVGSPRSFRYKDALLLGLMLVIVVIGGVLQHHVRACFKDQQQLYASSGFRLRSKDGVLACRHPVLSVAFWGSAEAWIARDGFATSALTALLAAPIWACFGTALYYARQALNAGWSRWKAVTHLSVGFIAGLLAGLVGIGGGLIFSPFFLLTGIDPAVAVATSATTVVFTSSSTTMQYFLMDRIQVDLAVTYGLVNTLASFCGTRFIQYVGDRCKKSYITIIVASSVAMSMAMSSIKCVELVRMALNGVIVP